MYIAVCISSTILIFYCFRLKMSCNVMFLYYFIVELQVKIFFFFYYENVAYREKKKEITVLYCCVDSAIDFV